MASTSYVVYVEKKEWNQEWNNRRWNSVSRNGIQKQTHLAEVFQHLLT